MFNRFLDLIANTNVQSDSNVMFQWLQSTKRLRGFYFPVQCFEGVCTL